MTRKKLLIIYEQKQVREVEKYIQSQEEIPDILVLDFWAERLLTLRNIPFISITTYPHARESRPDLLDLCHSFCREWYRLPETAFFAHRGLRIAEAAEIIISNLVQRILYFTNLLQPVFEAHSEYQHIIIPHTTVRLPIGAGPVDFFEYRAPLDVAVLLARRYDRTIELIGESHKPLSRNARDMRSFRHHALSLLNRVVSIASRERPLKIFASEYWSHIKPIMQNMPDAELVLMDRSEIVNVAWYDLLRHRIRFIHPQDCVTEASALSAKQKVEEFRKKWLSALPAIEVLARKLSANLVDLSWWEPVFEGMYHIVDTYAERVIVETDAIWQILERERINRVLLRASMSGRQHHFFTTAFIAHELIIPSVEIQHAGGEFERNAPGSRLSTSYLAAYGDLTKDLYVNNLRIAPERVWAVGSPRFDAYLQPLSKYSIHNTPDSSKKVILAAVPVENTGAALSTVRFYSYDVADFFRTFQQLSQEQSDVLIHFKFRHRECSEAHRRYITELFGDDAIISDGDFSMALVNASMVVSSKSTVMYETIMVGKPFICYPWKQDVYAHIYASVGPMFSDGNSCVAFINTLLTDKRASAALIDRQHRFITEHFTLDGHASERVATLLRRPLHSFPASYQ